MDGFILYWFAFFIPILTVRLLRTGFHWLRTVRP